MPRPHSDQPTEGELEILQVLWDGGPLSLSAVCEALRRNREVAATTVATMLRVMSDKKLAKQALGATEHTPILLMVANLAPHKGQEVAIRALVVLKELGVHAELWLAGIERDERCDFTNRLKALCHDLKIIPQVRFLGHRRDVPELLRAADVFLLPSTSEGLPLSILEAQASKVPVIAAPTAGIPEIVVNDVSGFLVNAGDAFGYAERVKQLVLCSDTVRRITTYAYKNIIANHGWSTYCDRLQSAYSALLEHA